jgi:hypothetical protein
MTILEIIAELREGLARLDEAIIVLENLSRTGTPRRGRSPAWRSTAAGTAPRRRNGKNGSLNEVALSASES